MINFFAQAPLRGGKPVGSEPCDDDATSFSKRIIFERGGAPMTGLVETVGDEGVTIVGDTRTSEIDGASGLPISYGFGEARGSMGKSFSVPIRPGAGDFTPSRSCDSPRLGEGARDREVTTTEGDFLDFEMEKKSVILRGVELTKEGELSTGELAGGEAI